MKKIGFIIVEFLVMFAALQTFGDAFLAMFNGHSEGDNIILTWQTGEENGVKEFVVQRKAVNEAFFDLNSLPAKGSNSLYTYVDENAFSKGNDLLFIYRLKMVPFNPNVPPTFSKEVTVSHNVSSVKRTWGSIKALFR
jgi:hypothetical protein